MIEEKKKVRDNTGNKTQIVSLVRSPPSWRDLSLCEKQFLGEHTPFMCGGKRDEYGGLCCVTQEPRLVLRTTLEVGGGFRERGLCTEIMSCRMAEATTL